MQGIGPPELVALPRLRDRLSFLYVERCQVNRDQNALTFRDEKGTVHVPVTAISALMFGPGTSVTHKAMSLVGESGGAAAWTGESGVRFYAGGRGLSRSNRLLRVQAEKSTHRHKRFAVAREMYLMRFPDEDVSGLTMQQLRGREGARVRGLYSAEARRTGHEWKGRNFDLNKFEEGDRLNRALSSANASLYGVVHSAILGLGLSPGLGFVHEGNDLCFIYDIADLYKAEISIPSAFEALDFDADDVASASRKLVRDKVFSTKLLQRMVRDMQVLLGIEEESEDHVLADAVTLWDLQQGSLESGVNYGGELA